MENIEMHNGEQGVSFFSLHVNEKEVGRMVVNTSSNLLEAGYTSIGLDQRKKGYGEKLVNAVADYARENNLKIKPTCGFVAMMFKKYPERYADVQAER